MDGSSLSLSPSLLPTPQEKQILYSVNASATHKGLRSQCPVFLLHSYMRPHSSAAPRQLLHCLPGSALPGQPLTILPALLALVIVPSPGTHP